MIISGIAGTSRTVDSGEEIRWRSLARRGMLHSECESFDYVRLAPGTSFELRGREGTENAWFTVSGSGKLSEPGAEQAERALKVGDLVLLPAGKEIRLTSEGNGLELLWLTVLPRVVINALPERRPEI